MTILNVKTTNLSIIFLITTVLISCSSNYKLTTSTQNTIQNEDFTIEGKFKIKINRIQENGYFLLKKQKNSINITIGKNYLLPERKFTYLNQDLILFSELIDPKEKGVPFNFFPQDIEIGQLISIILGKNDINRIDSWFINYPEGTQDINGFQIPPKTLLIKGDSYIEFILKKLTLI